MGKRRELKPNLAPSARQWIEHFRRTKGLSVTKAMTTAILALRMLENQEREHLIKWAFAIDETIGEEPDAWLEFEQVCAQTVRKREAKLFEYWAALERGRKDRAGRRSDAGTA